MKHLFLLLTAFLLPVLVTAQEGLVAVLYHGDDFKIYYSSDAFKNAMADAENGDVITLSPGTFTATSITKAVTIRGAGIGKVDSMNNGTVTQTIINSYSDHLVDVKPDASSEHILSIEGVVYNGPFLISNLSNSIISKTRFNSGVSRSSSDAVIDNITFIQCIFDNKIDLDLEATCSIYNSVIWGFSSNTCTANINNSAILVSKDRSYDDKQFTYHNCIFVSDNENQTLRSSTVNDCIWVGKYFENYGPFMEDNGKPERNNKVIPENEEIFIPGSFYILNDKGKKYLGSDGTEVGIYGSRLPFSTVTSYPQIKKFNISPESTTDGKLKIEFEIQ